MHYIISISIFNKKIETCKESEKCGPDIRKKKNQRKETVPEEAQTLDFLDKDFKSTVVLCSVTIFISHRKCILVYFLSAKLKHPLAKHWHFRDFFFSEDIIVFIQRFMNEAASHLTTRRTLPFQGIFNLKIFNMLGMVKGKEY